jgi:hypothetical protein
VIRRGPFFFLPLQCFSVIQVDTPCKKIHSAIARRVAVLVSIRLYNFPFSNLDQEDARQATESSCQAAFQRLWPTVRMLLPV